MQDDWDSGVTSVALIKLDWGTITVTGDRATVTTVETWALALDDGTTGQLPPERNVYQLVRENGTWKISADDHPDSDPQLPTT